MSHHRIARLHAGAVALTAALLVPFGRAAAQEVHLPRLGFQVSADRWNTIAGAANPGGGPGIGMRYQSDAFASMNFHYLRAYLGLDVFSVKNANTGGRAVLEDVTLGLNGVMPLRSGLTPYAGGAAHSLDSRTFSTPLRAASSKPRRPSRSG